MPIQTVAENNFQKEVIDHKGLVLVDFYADWCGPCQKVSPIIEALNDEIKQVKFVKVNVDANPELVSAYSIFSIPTFLIFKNGQLVSQMAGALAKERLLEEINKALDEKK